jgi:hypothetical protein
MIWEAEVRFGGKLLLRYLLRYLLQRLLQRLLRRLLEKAVNSNRSIAGARRSSMIPRAPTCRHTCALHP